MLTIYNASDCISIPTLDYIIVDIDSNAKNITKSEISKSPKCSGFYKEKLFVCVSINKDDMK